MEDRDADPPTTSQVAIVLLQTDDKLSCERSQLRPCGYGAYAGLPLKPGIRDTKGNEFHWLPYLNQCHAESHKKTMTGLTRLAPESLLDFPMDHWYYGGLQTRNFECVWMDEFNHPLLNHKLIGKALLNSKSLKVTVF